MHPGRSKRSTRSATLRLNPCRSSPESPKVPPSTVTLGTEQRCQRPTQITTSEWTRRRRSNQIAYQYQPSHLEPAKEARAARRRKPQTLLERRVRGRSRRLKINNIAKCPQQTQASKITMAALGQMIRDLIQIRMKNTMRLTLQTKKRSRERRDQVLLKDLKVSRKMKAAMLARHEGQWPLRCPSSTRRRREI